MSKGKLIPFGLGVIVGVYLIPKLGIKLPGA